MRRSERHTPRWRSGGRCRPPRHRHLPRLLPRNRRTRSVRPPTAPALAMARRAPCRTSNQDRTSNPRSRTGSHRRSPHDPVGAAPSPLFWRPSWRWHSSVGSPQPWPYAGRTPPLATGAKRRWPGRHQQPSAGSQPPSEAQRRRPAGPPPCHRPSPRRGRPPSRRPMRLSPSLRPQTSSTRRVSP